MDFFSLVFLKCDIKIKNSSAPRDLFSVRYRVRSVAKSGWASGISGGDRR